MPWKLEVIIKSWDAFEEGSSSSYYPIQEV